MPCFTYITTLSGLAMNFVQIDKAKTDTEFKVKLFEGLGLEWETMVLALTSMLDNFIVDSMKVMLLAQEVMPSYMFAQEEAAGGAPLSVLLGETPVGYSLVAAVTSRGH
ncbi:hypothetical protein SAY86_022977 [Trapa natans]|uniref:Uncharacterized protein n=1 Tax=Trapa natans TaxID=22666 RepID=A0AAN7R7H2_TRANT|nr:hypothetical protein SAY86_022977 [Trapa natans]